jgi:hypothetical protein
LILERAIFTQRSIGDIYRTSVAKKKRVSRFNANGTVASLYVYDVALANGQPNTTAVTAQAYWDNKYAFGSGKITYLRMVLELGLEEASISYTLPYKNY